MIGHCLKNEQPFGILLIRSGEETGPATTYDVGTLAGIQDWYQGSDGLLGVTAIGAQRFRLTGRDRQPDGLNIGEVDLLPDISGVPLPDEYKPLAKILAGVLDDLGRLYANLEMRFDDAAWVAYRFAEILPMGAEQKQACLELDDPVQCLEIVRDVLDTVRAPVSLDVDY